MGGRELHAPLSVVVATDPSLHSLAIRLGSGSSATLVFHYAQPEPALLELEGPLEDAPTLIRLKQRPLDQYPLVRHRVRWTSDL